jgi:hypothetical protein
MRFCIATFLVTLGSCSGKANLQPGADAAWASDDSAEGHPEARGTNGAFDSPAEDSAVSPEPNPPTKPPKDARDAAVQPPVATADGAAPDVPSGLDAASPRTEDAAGSNFTGTIVLGAPTNSSVRIKIFAGNQSGTAQIRYGTAPATYGQETAATPLVAGMPLEFSLTGLAANTQYYYQLRYQDQGYITASREHSFHTARPPGSTFTFTVQADSHLDENSNLDVYRQTLANVLAAAPDFHIDLGDTFMCEKKSAPLVATNATARDEPTVKARYIYERDNFGIATHSVSLFLVNGNHEGEAGWMANGTGQDLATWTARARLTYYANPVPDTFYSGDNADTPNLGKRASWYAWQWGDALFVVLDPYWYTTSKIDNDPWLMTLGAAQYRWLADTLASSTATFKLIFIHSLVGGLDGQMRGGVEAAPYFEWGGRNLDNTTAFEQKRPGWGKPIHQLLVDNKVTAVLHGHDHVYVKQQLDGIIYQELSQPSARNSNNGASLASTYHYDAGTIVSSSGYLRMTVAPEQVTAEYVRTWIPATGSAAANGHVDETWTVRAP